MQKNAVNPTRIVVLRVSMCITNESYTPSCNASLWRLGVRFRAWAHPERTIWVVFRQDPASMVWTILAPAEFTNASVAVEQSCCEHCSKPAGAPLQVAMSQVTTNGSPILIGMSIWIGYIHAKNRSIEDWTEWVMMKFVSTLLVVKVPVDALSKGWNFTW